MCQQAVTPRSGPVESCRLASGSDDDALNRPRFQDSCFAASQYCLSNARPGARHERWESSHTSAGAVAHYCGRQPWWQRGGCEGLRQFCLRQDQIAIRDRGRYRSPSDSCGWNDYSDGFNARVFVSNAAETPISWVTVETAFWRPLRTPFPGRLTHDYQRRGRIGKTLLHYLPAFTARRQFLLPTASVPGQNIGSTGAGTPSRGTPAGAALRRWVTGKQRRTAAGKT